MPRQLPWKIKSATTPQASSHSKLAATATSSATHSPNPRPRPTPTPKTEATPGSSSKSRLSLGRTPIRSPSTSPPPEPLKEEYVVPNTDKGVSADASRFMIEGIDHDDKYRMVEDEFLAVAGDFTRHLHTVEYQRLKNQAKSQNAETIQNISRPVTGEMTDLVKRRHAALDTAAKQRKGITRVLGKRAAGDNLTSEDESTRPRQPTSLQGLMDSPRKLAAPLTLSGAGTRVSAGFPRLTEASPTRRSGRPDTSAKREPTPDLDNNLYDQPPWPLKVEQRAGRALMRQGTPTGATDKIKAEFQTHNIELSGVLNHQRPAGRTGDAILNTSDEDDDLFSRLRSRRTEQKRRRESKIRENAIKSSESQTASLNEIPFI